MHDRYHVITGPPLSPKGVSTRELETLAIALNALKAPITAALADLTDAMVERAFNSLQHKDRQDLLDHLGIRMSAPRKPSRALCRDILTRLRRDARQNACRCGLHRLTLSVMTDVVATVFPMDYEAVTDPLNRWGAALLRATVFTWCNASVSDAHVVSWAIGQEWFRTAESAQGEREFDDVRVAARAVVEANPGFRRPDSLDSSSSGQVMPPDPMDTMDPREACRMLEATLAEAVRAARRVTEAVEDGRPPGDDDLAPLTGLRSVFDSVQAVFTRAGVETRSLRLEDLVRAAQTHKENSALRETLRDLAAVSCLPGSPATSAADAARAVAVRLLATADWGEQEQREAAALAALVGLVRLGRRPEAAEEILALLGQVAQVLPACAPAAVMANDLTLPEPAVAATETAAEPVVEKAVASAQRSDDGTLGAAGHVVEAADTGSVAVPVEHTPSIRQADEASYDAAHVHGDGTAEAAEQAVTEIPDTAADETQDITGAPQEEPPAPAPVVQAAPPPLEAPQETAAARTVPAEQTLTKLIAQRRFGLAHHLALALGHPDAQTTALRLAGAAARLGTGAGPDARTVADLVQRQGGFVGRDTEGSELILLPALLRVALVTGDHSAGAQLKALVPRLPGALGDVAATVADRALSGALMIASPLGMSADVSEAEARLRELKASCAALLTPQRLRFNRASAIAKRWLAPGDGLLGSMLTAVVQDDRDALPAVQEKAERLSKLSEVNDEIDRMDRKYRGPSGKPLQGAGRQDLVHLVERVVNQAKEWRLAVDESRRAEHSGADRATKEISSLRQTMLVRRDAVLAELGRMTRRPDSMACAAASAAHSTMEELFALLSGDRENTRPDSLADPDVTLDVELLKVCDTTSERPALDVLLTAADRSWTEALSERLASDAFLAARTIVELASRGELPGPPPYGLRTRTEIDGLEAIRRVKLEAGHDELLAELRRAQAAGAVTDDQDLWLQELLADARTRLDDIGQGDLLDVRRALDTARGYLPEYRKEATDRIKARLDALGLDHGKQAQALRHLAAGELATAADLVYFLEIGQDVPEIEAGESHLTEFFPAVPDGLTKGIDAALVTMIRSGGRHPSLPALDYGHLSSDEAALVADALDDWRELGATDPKDRPNISAKRQLLPALKLLGYDAKGARPLDDLSPRRREYRFYEATEVEVGGRARVPAFGSQLKERGGNLRVLVLWGRPPAEVVMSRASQEPSGAGLLVVYFGTLSREARTELAAGSASAGLPPLLVVDDAALAYLAARGNRQAGTATQILLPFSGVNPYISEKRGRIGKEMFYGRDAERASVLSPHGTQVIFGGRGLGKSALLSDSGERFKEQRPGYHQYVYVNLDQENIGKGSALGPEALWSVLSRELLDAGVLPPGKSRGRKALKDPAANVRAGIRSWLDEDSQRGLLILLDECDQFFEADAPRFEQTKMLKGLGSDTKDRAKVVFAGLHSVQRFSKLASNGPFGHLAQTPTVIGPLAPQYAADLLVEPMRALGFEFAAVDLVNRVLGHCSYQPFLLQMFGHRLVELMHRKRARRGAEGPPYTVESADIETVESDIDLRDSISAAFKDTLTLDHRYDVIANVLAYQARHGGLETRLSDAELREECETYWKAGFAQLDTEGFRAYLAEMVGLGVLAPNHDGQGWHLRGPNALRMIGTSQEVEARLMRAEQDCKLKESIVLEGRPELSDGRPAPLTVAQLDDLLGRRADQTRVVLGTLATGISDVSDTLRTVAGRINGWKLPPVSSPSAYKHELISGDPGERRVIISDLVVGHTEPVRPETCREAVDLADTRRPTTPGVSRAVVIVTDSAQLALWRTLLMGEERTPAAPVVLRRHDRRSLRDWAQREKAEGFNTDDRLDRLHALTGGWPYLVDRAHQLYGELKDAEAVLRRLADTLTDRSWAREFVRATGVHADPVLAAGYQALVAEIGDGPADTDIVLTVLVCQTDDEEEARWIFACLDALQVFDSEEGQLRLEPVLRQCVEIA